MAKQTATEIMASRIVRHEYISAEEALRHLVDYFGCQTVISAVHEMQQEETLRREDAYPRWREELDIYYLEEE